MGRLINANRSVVSNRSASLVINFFCKVFVTMALLIRIALRRVRALITTSQKGGSLPLMMKKKARLIYKATETERWWINFQWLEDDK